jgi:hypothetical protein
MRGAGLRMQGDEMVAWQRDEGAFEESVMRHPLRYSDGRGRSPHADEVR